MDARWMAAVLASGDGAVLSHRSAAEAWDLLPRSGGAIETTRAKGWRDSQAVKAHRGRLGDDEVTIVNRLPVTTVPRTILDLAGVVPRRRLELALNEMEVRRMRDRLSIPDLLERYPRRRGTAALRALLREEAGTRGVTRSELEERFLATLEHHDLPRPRLNVDLVVYGRNFTADCLWVEQRLIVELDGRAAHDTARAFERDRERDRLLLADGWRVIRLTWRQLRDDEAGVVANLTTPLGRE
jgi:very-short-patch-repair endonuclease